MRVSTALMHACGFEGDDAILRTRSDGTIFKLLEQRMKPVTASPEACSCPSAKDVSQVSRVLAFAYIYIYLFIEMHLYEAMFLGYFLFLFLFYFILFFFPGQPGFLDAMLCTRYSNHKTSAGR
jgi:hypothetical protein